MLYAVVNNYLENNLKVQLFRVKCISNWLYFCFRCQSMAGGVNGALGGHAHGHAVGVWSFLTVSALLQYHRMGDRTVWDRGSNTSPAILRHAQKTMVTFYK